MGVPGFVKLCEEGHGFAWIKNREGYDDNYSFLKRCPCRASTWGILEQYEGKPVGWTSQGNLVDIQIVGLEALSWKYWEIGSFGAGEFGGMSPIFAAVNRTVSTPKYDLFHIKRLDLDYDPFSSWEEGEDFWEE